MPIPRTGCPQSSQLPVSPTARPDPAVATARRSRPVAAGTGRPDDGPRRTGLTDRTPKMSRDALGKAGS